MRLAANGYSEEGTRADRRAPVNSVMCITTNATEDLAAASM